MHPHSRPRGMALISALLLLLVVTMLSVGMFRSFGLQERIAGNTREKQRATHAAEGTQTNVETWLVNNANTVAAGASSAGVTCSGIVTAPVVCSNVIQNVTTVPWSIGVQYQPAALTIGTAGTANAYISPPEYYISFLGQNYVSASGTQTVAYQVDAMSYGGTTNTVAVVESTYLVSISYNARNDDQKFINLGGP